MRSSPGVIETRVSSPLASVVTGAFDAAAVRSCSETSRGPRKKSKIRAAVYAARCRASLSQSEEETMA
jgi:Cu/Ag efflux pump CusA